MSILVENTAHQSQCSLKRISQIQPCAITLLCDDYLRCEVVAFCESWHFRSHTQHAIYSELNKAFLGIPVMGSKTDKCLEWKGSSFPLRKVKITV